MKRRPIKITQFPRPTAPASFGRQMDVFVRSVNDIFEDIYRRYGRLRLEDLSAQVKDLLGTFAKENELTTLAQVIEALSASVKSADDQIIERIKLLEADLNVFYKEFTAFEEEQNARYDALEESLSEELASLKESDTYLQNQIDEINEIIGNTEN